MKKLLFALIALLIFPSVTACAAEKPADFSDVPSGVYYADAAAYCASQGLVNGTSAGVFSPNTAFSRGMLATILWRLDGKPSAARADFTDLTPGAYYEAAVNWAASVEIVSGYGDGRFGPNDPIERQQLATMLHRYAAYQGRNVAVTNPVIFADSDAIRPYAKNAVAWAKDRGILFGKPKNLFAPADTATRAEAVTMLYRYLLLDPPPLPDEPEEEVTMKRVFTYCGDKKLEIVLAENPSAAAFAEKLREGDITVSLDDYGDFEKVGALGFSLVQSNTQITTAPGDVILYQGNQITMYYDTNNWNFTLLGSVEHMTRETMLDFFGGKGRVTVRFSLN